MRFVFQVLLSRAGLAPRCRYSGLNLLKDRVIRDHAMQKFLKYSKLALLVWGAISLGFVLFVMGVIAFEQISKSAPLQQQRDEVREPMLQKRFGDLELTIMVDQQGTFLLSLFRAGQAVVTDYELPIGDYRLDEIYLHDASVVPLAGGAYRVMLHSYGPGESNEGHLWLLKFDGKMRLVKMIPISEPHQLDEKKTRMFGNVSIVLPVIDESDGYKTIAVPTRVSIGEDIRIAPLLNAQDIETLSTYYGEMIAARMAKLNAPENAEKLAQYKQAAIEFKENLTSRSIPY